tara:strand:+ start:7750 stop:9051 length:1302 start_codon:yes stop_codon:yes gene_type:complete
LPGFDHGERAREASNSGDYEAALLAARAALCQYAIWHKSNTAPFMNNPNIETMLKIDIEALSELVGDVCAFHFRLDRTDELPAVLERTRSLVSDTRWQRKITYHQALILDAAGEEAQAKKEFAKLGTIDPKTENDVEILQAYLDLFDEDQSFADKNAICDRILALTRSTSDVVQYRGVKAMAYAGIGDWGEARKQLAIAVADGHRKEREKVLGVRTRMLLASELSFLGLLTREDRHFIEAERHFKSLLADQEQWSVEGRAILWSYLGECYRYWGKWAEGGDAYREALHLHPTGIQSVFLAECEMHGGRKNLAASLLDGVDFAALPVAEQIDYSYVLAELAIESSDRGRLKSALTMLEGVKPTEPYFEQRRLSFMVEVQAALANEHGASMWQNLKDVLQRFNQYILLKPNFMGLGVDFNAMIADSVEPKGKDDD